MSSEAMSTTESNDTVLDDPEISVIVPTLNEEAHIRSLFESIERQSSVSFEVLMVDGGSNDRTSDVARVYGAKAIVLPGYGEFVSRNVGAEIARGKYLLFTCADIVFPDHLFQKIIQKFESHPDLIAFTGPGYPFDAPIFGKAEYAAYNLVRFLFAKLPWSLKRFSTSTNFLVVQREFFAKTGGFAIDDINADGLMGKKLLELGKVAFFLDTSIYLSARRMKNMGFVNFNKHYLYALENFFFFASRTGVLQSWKHRSRSKHHKMHEA
jgi:glycosyltransferase involved in cell wall biosynthesis